MPTNATAAPVRVPRKLFLSIVCLPEEIGDRRQEKVKDGKTQPFSCLLYSVSCLSGLFDVGQGRALVAAVALRIDAGEIERGRVDVAMVGDLGLRVRRAAGDRLARNGVEGR